MAIVRDDAVVLMRYDFSETSQIIVLLTRGQGKVRGIAKGIRRSTKTRFAVGIDLLDLGHVLLGRRREGAEGLVAVTEWKQTRSLWGLREKLARIHAAQYAAEITAHLLEDWDAHPGLYEALVEALIELSGTDETLWPVVRYQRFLLEAVGSLPRFDACVACGREDELTYFSSREGGTICRPCGPSRIEKHGLSNETREVCRALPSGSAEAWAPPTDRPLVGAFSLLNYHIAHLIGRQPRLAAKLAGRKQNAEPA